MQSLLNIAARVARARQILVWVCNAALAAGLAGTSAGAVAQTFVHRLPSTQEYQVNPAIPPGANGWFLTKSAACSDWGARGVAENPGSCQGIDYPTGLCITPYLTGSASLTGFTDWAGIYYPDYICRIVKTSAYKEAMGGPVGYHETSMQSRTVVGGCPANSTLVSPKCRCNPGYGANPQETECHLLPLESTAEAAPGMCAAPGMTTGNPIVVYTGEKVQEEVDWVQNALYPLAFKRIFRSDWANGAAPPQGPRVGLGRGWSHSWAAYLEKAGTVIRVWSEDGTLRVFNLVGSQWVGDTLDTLVQQPNGSYLFTRADDEVKLQFDADGLLQGRTERNGLLVVFNYNVFGGMLRVVAVHSPLSSAALQIGYTSTGLMNRLIFNGETIVTYGFDAQNRLSTVTYKDGAVKTYHYEDGANPWALTGITDENGARYATFTYGSGGKATGTQHAGGAGASTIAYGAGSAVITDALGTQRTFSYGMTGRRVGVSGASMSSGGGAGDVASRTFDGFGLVQGQEDFLGTTAQFAWDTARALPLSVTQAANRPEARTRQTTWHPVFRLPLTMTEAGRATAFTYDAGGNMLTRSVSDGAGGQTRTWAWAYDAKSLVTKSSVPNGATTTYGYNATRNLTSITDPLGRVTSMTYDVLGRVTSVTQPTGLVSTFGYDARDRVVRSVRGGLTTTYTYRPSGQVAGVSMPSGHSITFAYDSAQRLTGWQDNRGAQAVYTLDAMGNRTAEQVKDGLGTTVWQLARTINGLNQVSSETLGANQGTSYGYDANGEVASETNGLNQSTSYTLDGHRRVIALTDAANATAQIAYNALDGVTGASDFKGSATGYTRNAFGEATQETSADAGTRATQYNSLGLPTQVTDAMSQATTIQRDVLGRPTQLTFADGKITYLRYDLTGSNYNAAGAPNASKGYLSEMEDRAGITRWQRDIQGRITQKVQTLANGAVHTVGYSYNAQGLLETITYPNGATLGHVYSAAGQLTAMTWNASPLVSNITWNAMGQPTGWTWAFNSATASRTYDTAGRVTATEFSGYTYDAAGRITSLTQNLGAPADSNPANSSITFANRTFTVTYDAVGRITGFGDGTDSTSFTYDANGNRLTSTRVEGSTTIAKTYSVMSGGNRLLGYTQATSGPTGSSSAVVSYTYNANGEMTSDGLSQYAFNAENRLSSVTLGNTQTSPTTRYAHNALGQRVFKTEPLYEDIAEEPGDSGFWDSLAAFFRKLWTPATKPAEQLGFAYTYDEDGTLIGEYGSGGAQSTGTGQYVWLPTPSGPMPIVAVMNGSKYAVHSDHLNTPRKLTNEQGQAAWQWKYSAFGDEQPTRAANRFADPEKTPGAGTTNVADVVFNFRYPGQYADKESGLFYNANRTLDPDDSVYTQPDPIGLDGGWNRVNYGRSNPLRYMDREGLFVTSADMACMQNPSLCAEIGGTIIQNAAALSGDSCLQVQAEKVADNFATAGTLLSAAALANIVVHASRARDAVGPALPESYWIEKRAATQVTPGVRTVNNPAKASSAGGTYHSTDHYDEFGRLIGQTHWTSHGRVADHPNPHHHRRNPKNGDVIKTPGGSRVWPGLFGN